MFRSFACDMSARVHMLDAATMRFNFFLFFAPIFDVCIPMWSMHDSIWTLWWMCCHCSAFTYTKTKCILCVSNCRKTSISLGNYLSHFGSHTHSFGRLHNNVIRRHLGRKMRLKVLHSTLSDANTHPHTRIARSIRTRNGKWQQQPNKQPTQLI